MKILIAGGTGFIGQFLVSHYLKSAHEIIVLGRDAVKIQSLYGDMVESLDWDGFNLMDPSALKQIDLIINLAGASIAEKRWTKQRKKIIIDSRVETTRAIVEKCQSLKEKSPPLFNASAIGIYGIQTALASGLPSPLTEETPIEFDHFPNFSAQVTRLWEKETHRAKANHVRVVNMRFGVVMGKNGGALSRLTLPFKFFLGGKIASGQQPFSWISIEDLARAIDFIYQKKEINGPVNFVSPQCVTQYQLAKSIAQILKKPSFAWTPEFMLKLAFGEMAEELLINGQNVFPQLLLDNKFIFTHPEINSVLAYALK